MAVNIQKNSNVVRVPAIRGMDFFFKWLNFIKPLHSMTNLEMKVLSAMLAKRYELLAVVKDEKVIASVMRSSQTRKELREQLGITSTQMNILHSKLKKSGVINDCGVLSKFIPNMECNSSEYRMILTFDIKEGDTQPLQ